jgi:hypothetical protein
MHQSFLYQLGRHIISRASFLFIFSFIVIDDWRNMAQTSLTEIQLRER